MFEKYSHAARRSLIYSRHEALLRGSRLIETEHILLGLLRENEDEKAVVEMIRSFDVDPSDLQRAIDENRAFGEPIPSTEIIPLSQNVIKALACACDEAEIMMHAMVDPCHIFAGLLDVEGCMAMRILSQHGVDINLVREKIGTLYEVASTSSPTLDQNLPREEGAASAPDMASIRGKVPTSTRAIFICYRRSDSMEVVGRMHDRLVAHYGGDNVFIDVDSIPLGVDFRTYVEIAMEQARIVVVTIGKNWLSRGRSGALLLGNPRDSVRIELEHALRRNLPIIPVLASGAKMPSERDLPKSLAKMAYRNGIELRSDPYFHKDIDRLIAGIDALLGPMNQ